MKDQSTKSERTRNFIIETTAAIFNKKGYAGTSMSDLTEATGLTKGSIYGNFDNKEEVAISAFHYNLGKISSVVAEHIAKAGTSYDKLMAYAKVYDQLTRKSFMPGGCPILNTAIEADDTNEVFREKAASAIINWRNKIQEIIKKGIEAGEFKKDTDSGQLAISMIALIEGGIMISRVTRNHSHMEKVMQTIELLVTQIKV